jgi:methylglutaconyl-CoA hydratase
MLKTLDRLSKPTIARVHGSAFGGGAGLVACCDIAFAAQDTTFSFSEAKLGLIPATIAPYVVEAIGARYARRHVQINRSSVLYANELLQCDCQGLNIARSC